MNVVARIDIKVKHLDMNLHSLFSTTLFLSECACSCSPRLCFSRIEEAVTACLGNLVFSFVYSFQSQ